MDAKTTEQATTTPTPEPGSSIPPEQLEQLTADIVAALKTVYDPEIPADIYELGLIYKIDASPDGHVVIDMTLTSAACPLTDVIEDQSRGALVSSGLCTDMEINWVWLPPWGPDKITDDGREQLRALGFTV